MVQNSIPIIHFNFSVVSVEVVADEVCPRCTPLEAKLLKFQFRSNAFSVPIPSQYKGCVLCDPDLRLWLFESGSSTSSTSVPAAASNSFASGAGSGAGARGGTRGGAGTGPGDRRGKRRIVAKSDNPMFIGAPTRGITIERSSDPEQILCDCGHVATAMVGQRGQNAGRTYYTCAVCQFKHWEGDPLDQIRVMCDCGRVARMKTSKTGKNSGRQFYECQKLNDEDCGFFAWKEDAMAAMGSGPSNPPAALRPSNDEDEPSIVRIF